VKCSAYSMPNKLLHDTKSMLLGMLAGKMVKKANE
jgi:hypothetical protein